MHVAQLLVFALRKDMTVLAGPYLSVENSQEATVALFRGFQHKEVIFLQTFVLFKYAAWGWTQTGKKEKKTNYMLKKKFKNYKSPNNNLT